MQLRYLAAAGPPEALDRLASELGSREPALQPVLQAPALSVWTMPQTPFLVSHDGQAAAIGLLFETASGRRLTELPSPLPEENSFMRRYWGAYVLLARESAASHSLMRDPSGGVTAYHRRSGALDLYASDGFLLASAATEPFTPDIEFLRQWLTFRHLRSLLTGARGVSEIVPGTIRRAAGACATFALAWSPWDHCHPDCLISDFDTAAGLLREAIRHAVPRLLETARDPVLRLSGGLDSSIVAAALAHSGRPFRAVTFATRARDGDERAHARVVARHCGIELTELVEETIVPDFDQVPAFALRPSPHTPLQPLHGAVANHLSRTGADLVIDGAGGDNVFCYLNSASPALDAIRLAGPRAGLAALGELARLHGTTLWSVARAARRRSKRARVRWVRDETFLAPSAVTEEPADHPWLEGPAAGARGEFERLQSIVGMGHFLADPGPRAPPALHPLLAQPVLEACFRVPSWLWVRGGRDRAVARAAFRGLLPESILARRSKGSLASIFMTGYMAARAQLESQLLDGRLSEAGLLDRDAIRDYLRQEAEPRDVGYIRLLDLASAEAWLRSFER